MCKIDATSPLFYNLTVVVLIVIKKKIVEKNMFLSLAFHLETGKEKLLHAVQPTLTPSSYHRRHFDV